ncbi:MAG: fibronectin type III domain-containing protein [Eubacterium sp.]|nr:fibronectin type III domain-containing protein [Eubacterium sp.]
MKFTKKLLSFMLAIAMLFSITTGINLSAYATVDDELIEDSNYQPIGTITSDFSKVFKLSCWGSVFFTYEFKPEKDGLYELSIKTQNKSVTNCTFISDDYEIYENGYKAKHNCQMESGNESSIVAHCYATKTYGIFFQFNIDDPLYEDADFSEEDMFVGDEDFPTTNITVELKKYTPPEISVGKEQIIEIQNGIDQEMYYYSFTPEESGLYRFSSTTMIPGESVVVGWKLNVSLYDKDMNEIDVSKHKDDGDDCFDYYCQSGETYVFGSGFYHESYGHYGDKIKMSVDLAPHDEHNYDNGKVTKKATCKAKGVKTYTCTICGETKTETIAKTAHTYKTTTTKATTKKNGSITKKCSVCGSTTKTTIYYPKTVTLSTTSYTYNGKVKKPSVTVKDSKGKKIATSNYTISYQSGRKNVGTYTVTIKFKGNYSGTIKKTFTIKPKATTLSSVTAKSKGFTAKWKKLTTQTTGYQIQYSTSSKFSSAKTVTVSKNSTTSKSVSKLKAKKKYYVRIRTYKTVKVNGKSTKIYSAWSKSKSVKTK